MIGVNRVKTRIQVKDMRDGMVSVIQFMICRSQGVPKARKCSPPPAPPQALLTRDAAEACLALSIVSFSKSTVAIVAAPPSS